MAPRSVLWPAAVLLGASLTSARLNGLVVEHNVRAPSHQVSRKLREATFDPPAQALRTPRGGEVTNGPSVPAATEDVRAAIIKTVRLPLPATSQRKGLPLPCLPAAASCLHACTLPACVLA